MFDRTMFRLMPFFFRIILKRKQLFSMLVLFALLFYIFLKAEQVKYFQVKLRNDIQKRTNCTFGREEL